MTGLSDCELFVTSNARLRKDLSPAIRYALSDATDLYTASSPARSRSPSLQQWPDRGVSEPTKRHAGSVALSTQQKRALALTRRMLMKSITWPTTAINSVGEVSVTYVRNGVKEKIERLRR